MDASLSELTEELAHPFGEVAFVEPIKRRAALPPRERVDYGELDESAEVPAPNNNNDGTATAAGAAAAAAAPMDVQSAAPAVASSRQSGRDDFSRCCRSC